uniref:ATP/GTP-binding protein n=1 Tax=Clostridioides difficile TaxID=1496 RepID=A0A381I4S1_CLODI|nr:ATP/GTP-binding protein [Clostridioides difficile]
MQKKFLKNVNIPIRYVACLENLVEQLPKDLEGEIFPIKLYMREDWM